VPPIVDDNDEFSLDISEPTSIPSLAKAPAAEAPRPVPQQIQAQPASLSPPLSTHPARKDDDPALDLVEPRPERRNRVERRRSDRRFSNLLDEKSGGSQSFDSDDDDFSMRRSQPPANASMAQAMIGLAVVAIAIKGWFFVTVAMGWDLSKMTGFLAEQFASGLAIVGLIVLALSCMKK
jgi:hypothetical protein